jgi:hypothetical protein
VEGLSIPTPLEKNQWQHPQIPMFPFCGVQSVPVSSLPIPQHLREQRHRTAADPHRAWRWIQISCVPRETPKRLNSLDE